MKKFYFVLFALMLVMFAASPAFALDCKQGNSLNSDECWTEGYFAESPSTSLSVGTVMAVSYNYAGTLPYQTSGFTKAGSLISSGDGFIVKRANSSVDGTVLGAIQQTYASSSLPGIVRIKRLGYGLVKVPPATLGTETASEIVSGDPIRVFTSTGTFTGYVVEIQAADNGRGKVGTALGNSTEKGSDNVIPAYINTMGD